MSAPAFTPGPWPEPTPTPAGNWLVGGMPAICGARTQADGHLIAAAPCLYRSLRDLLELVRVHGLEQCGDLPAHEFEAIVDGAVQDAACVLAKVDGTCPKCSGTHARGVGGGDCNGPPLPSNGHPHAGRMMG